MKILKFGGSSVGSVENLKRIVSILQDETESFVVIVSAFSGVTNQLHEIAENALTGEFQSNFKAIQERHYTMINELFTSTPQKLVTLVDGQLEQLHQLCKGVYTLQELTDRTMARIMAKGELLSSLIIECYLQENNLSVERIDSRELIVATHDYLSADVNFEQTNANILTKIDQKRNYILPGFIGRNEQGQDVVLGRGGSDYTASIVGSALNASAIELWSDVDGMKNANPRVVKQAKTIREMSYEEAFEIAYFGAKVLYPPAIKPAMKEQVPVCLKNTLRKEDQGTVIHHLQTDRSDKLLGVSTLANISLLNITGIGLAGVKGSAKRVFGSLEQASVNVILISQSCSEQSICLGLATEDAEKAREAIQREFKEEIVKGFISSVEVEHNQVILALIGDQMKHQIGLSGAVFSVLGENNINIRAIAQGASERNISIVIHEKDEHKALNVVHEKFFQNTTKKIHLFVFGKGNVGSEFLSILQQQRAYCQQQFQVDLKIVLLANSKQYCFNELGLSSEEISEFKSKSTSYTSIEELVELIQKANLRNSIVIDNTASKVVSDRYTTFLKNSISIATCNKIACSSSYSLYQNLKQLSQRHNCSFLYETAVGASLPVIKTIQNLNLSGDKVRQIAAVVSGSLNFIFNHYDGSKPFVEIVQQAMEEGYTEPDPRIDLSGLDVKRKLLILAREAGLDAEMNDVHFESFLPEQANTTESVEQFLTILTEQEAHFQQLLERAKANQAKLKVVATMNGENLVVSLKQVKVDSPFYYLDGKDNIVALTTNYYNPEPLVVKGAGAGATVTASGVFSDLMYIVNQQ